MSVLDSNSIMFTSFEPKVSNRFIAYVDGVPSYLIKSIQTPSFDAGEIVLDHINVYRKIKGKVRWSDLSMTMYDPITPSGSQTIMEWLRLSHESVTGRDGYSDFYKKDIVINIIGPPGDVVGEWILKGAYCKTASFGDYDWANDVAISIDMTVAMDYCILNY